MAKKESKLFDNEPKAVDMDINLDAIRKKRIRINGDDSKIIELNMSDLNIGNRLETAYNKLSELMNDAASKARVEDNEELTDEESERILSALSDIDKQMREQVDYIFDYPVSAVCADSGSMWDPINGSFRYEYIIEALIKLYENNLSEEFVKIKKRVDSAVNDKKKAISKYHR